MARQRLDMRVKKQIKDLKEKGFKNIDIKKELGLRKLDRDDVAGQWFNCQRKERMAEGKKTKKKVLTADDMNMKDIRTFYKK